MDEPIYKISQATIAEENKPRTADTSGETHTFTVNTEKEKEE